DILRKCLKRKVTKVKRSERLNLHLESTLGILGTSNFRHSLEVFYDPR
ncbi:MAG: hypothetical protein H6Q41_3072, partial [Deltaproteobacteria bacterium]|nr:hypothetical protein [Deltaproteobacteria bacterium]